MRSLLWIFASALVGCASCNPTPTPIPAAPDGGADAATDAEPLPVEIDASSVDATTAQVIYEALVEAGCMAADDGGALAIAQEQTLDADPWLQCLFNNGSIGSCNVPCE